MDLRPLNPDIDLSVQGTFTHTVGDSSSTRFVMLGLIATSNWSKPFGLDWLRFGDVEITLSMDKDGLQECTMKTSASVTFPSISNSNNNKTQTIEFHGLLTRSNDLVFTTSLANGEQVTLASLPRLVADLLDLDYESLAPVLNSALNVAENIKVSFAISTAEGSFTFDLSENNKFALQVGKGLTIMTSVDAGAVVENITKVFYTPVDLPTLEFRAGVVVPIFDVLTDLNSFKQNFETFLSTPDVKINDQFTFLGIIAIIALLESNLLVLLTFLLRN